jgi:hypothetical protein
VTKFQIAIRKFSVYFAKPIWSFIVNCVFWLGHLDERIITRKNKEWYATFKLDELMRMFKWREDNFGDWTPWPMTLVCIGLEDDCDGAANLAKWWFTEHGVEAEILNLYSATEGHAICVTKDRTKMVSNDQVVDLNPATWEQCVLKYFNNKYVVMI